MYITGVFLLGLTFLRYCDRIIAIEYLLNGFRETEIKRESGQNPEQPPLPYQMN